MAFLPAISQVGRKFHLCLTTTLQCDVSIVVTDPAGSTTVFLPPSGEGSISSYFSKRANTLRREGGTFEALFEPAAPGKHLVRFLVRTPSQTLEFLRDFVASK